MTAVNYHESLHALATAQKTTKGAPAYSRFVNRRLGRYLAAGAHTVRLSPNEVTALSAAFSFTGIIALATWAPSIVLGIVVTLCLVLGYALDSADGQLARLRGGGSVAGEWLDHMVDAIKISTLHAAVLISAFRFMDAQIQVHWLLVPIGFMIVSAVSFFGMILNDQLRRVNGGPNGQKSVVVSASSLRSWIVLPTDYGVLCLIFLLLGWPVVFFAAYTVLFAACTGFLVLALFKWYRDMRAIDARGQKGEL